MITCNRCTKSLSEHGDGLSVRGELMDGGNLLTTRRSWCLPCFEALIQRAKIQRAKGT